MEHKTKKETGKKETHEKKEHTTAKKKAEHHEDKTVKASARATKAPKAKKAAPAKHEDAKTPARRCKIDSCKREYRAKGYCRAHYKMWRHGKFGRARFKACKDYGCFKPMAMNRHGFCEEHYQNYYVKGMEQAHVPAAAEAQHKGAPSPAKKEEKAAS